MFEIQSTEPALLRVGGGYRWWGRLVKTAGDTNTWVLSSSPRGNQWPSPDHTFALWVEPLGLLLNSPLSELDLKGFTKQINNVNEIAASNFRGAAVKAYCTIIVCI